ncbi:MAG: metallophosphoesterase [Methanobacteriota archaeon]
MDIEYLAAGPALQIIGERRIVVVADIHMGIESDLRLHGIHVQSRGPSRIARLIELVRDSSPDIILMLGDIKHRVPGTSWQEFREIPALFSELRRHADIRVTPGNHDPGIEEFLRSDEILPKEGSLLDGIGVLHGHTKPDPSLAGHLIIVGHHHPVASLYDEVGIALRSPCYVLAELNENVFERPEPTGGKSRILMVPAFNEFSGYGIEKTFRSPFSPLSRAVIKETAECLLADGTYAGDLLSLIRHERPENS